MWRLLSCISILDLLDGLLGDELCVVAFSYELFEVYLPRPAVGYVMHMCCVEGIVLVSTPFVSISLQRWWSTQTVLVFHLEQDLMYGDSKLCIAFIY